MKSKRIKLTSSEAFSIAFSLYECTKENTTPITHDFSELEREPTNKKS